MLSETTGLDHGVGCVGEWLVSALDFPLFFCSTSMNRELNDRIQGQRLSICSARNRYEFFKPLSGKGRHPVSRESIDADEIRGSARNESVTKTSEIVNTPEWERAHLYPKKRTINHCKIQISSYVAIIHKGS